MATLFLALGGCSTVDINDGTAIRTFVGIVKVRMPEAAGSIHAVDVETLGVGRGRDGFFLGWQKGSWVEADPADCQLLVIIRSPVEAANAATILESLKGEDVCVADYTEQLARAR